MTSRFLAVPLAIIAACGVACVSIHVATTASAPVAASPDIVDATTAPHRLGAFGDPVATTWSYLAGDGGASLVVPALSVLSGLTVCSGSGGGTVTVAPVGTLPDGAPLDGSVAGQTVILPASTCLSPPSILGANFSLGPKTTIAFTGVTSYWATLASYGSF